MVDVFRDRPAWAVPQGGFVPYYHGGLITWQERNGTNLVMGKPGTAGWASAGWV